MIHQAMAQVLQDEHLLNEIFSQLDLRSITIASLVTRQWTLVTSALLDRIRLRGDCLETIHEQAAKLQAFHLTRSAGHLLPHLHLLSNLRELVIRPDMEQSAHIYSISSVGCLANVLPNVSFTLRSLSIHGQHSRLKRRSPLADLPTGTDCALSTLANSRSSAGNPGLRSLTFTSSDLSDAGLLAYLAWRTIPVSPERQGASLRHIALVNCILVTFTSLRNLAEHCPNLEMVTLKLVPDSANSDWAPKMEAPIDAEHAFVLLANRCRQLHTLSLSFGEAKISPDAFSGFTDHQSLRELHLSASRCLTYAHVSRFNTLRKLVISGCPTMGTDLPFEAMLQLQALSYLGSGLTVASVWKLWTKCTLLRTCTLDAAGYLTNAEAAGVAQTGAGNRTLLPCLSPYGSANVLSDRTSLPSWALTYLLSFAPCALESLTLAGTLIQEKSELPGLESRVDSTPQVRIRHQFIPHASVQTLGLFAIQLYTWVWTYITVLWAFVVAPPHVSSATATCGISHSRSGIVEPKKLPSDVAQRTSKLPLPPCRRKSVGAPANLLSIAQLHDADQESTKSMRLPVKYFSSSSIGIATRRAADVRRTQSVSFATQRVVSLRSDTVAQPRDQPLQMLLAVPDVEAGSSCRISPEQRAWLQAERETRFLRLDV